MKLYPLKTDVQKARLYQTDSNNEFALFDIDNAEVLNGFLAENTITELLEVYMYDMVGEKVYNRFGNSLPIAINLVKTDKPTEVLMDATPSGDEQSIRLWHILDASNGEIKIGCKNKAENLYHTYKVNEGDTLLVKSNQAFEIDANFTFMEIAYLPSELNKALPLSKLSEAQAELLEVSPNANAMIKVKTEKNKPQNLYQTEKLTANLISIDGAIARDYYPLDSFVMISCTEGQLILDGDFDDTIALQKGETAFIPADIKELKFIANTPKCAIIETYINTDKK